MHPSFIASHGARLVARRTLCRAATGNGATPLTEFKVATFSSRPYVVNFLEAPLKAVFPKSTMLTVRQTHTLEIEFSLQARLDKSSAALAEGHDAVICFVNDDCGTDV